MQSTAIASVFVPILWNIFHFALRESSPFKFGNDLMTRGKKDIFSSTDFPDAWMVLYETPLTEKVGASWGQKDVKSCIAVTISLPGMAQVWNQKWKASLLTPH